MKRKLPVFLTVVLSAGVLLAGSCDVLVVGGGAAGIAAALQAGRAGASVVLVERGFQVGGNMTTGGVSFPGLFHAWGRQVIDGYAYELVTNAVALSGERLPDFSKTPKRHWMHQLHFDIPVYVALAEESLERAGVRLRYHTAPMKVSRVGDIWKVTLVADGTAEEMVATVLIDCTGDGTLAAMAGAKRMRERETSPGSFMYTFVNGRELWDACDRKRLETSFKEAVKNGEIRGCDATFGLAGIFEHVRGTSWNYVPDADTSTAEKRTDTNMRARASMLRVYRFLKRQPGFEKLRLGLVSPEVGVRETWRVEGDYVMTADDYISGRRFDDGVCHAFYPVDLHSASDGVAPKPLTPGVVPSVPLRCLLVRNLPNLLVAGRCVSGDRLAVSGLRVQAACMATGQAAGEAAALAASRKCDVRALPFQLLRERLEATGAIVPDCTNGAAVGLFFAPGGRSAAVGAMEEIRPGNPKTGTPFWNVNAASFMYPPAFDFKDLPREDAERSLWRTVRFRFSLHCSDGRVRTFVADEPWASLKPVWDEVPVGPVVMTCEGLSEAGTTTGYSGVRAFWRTAPFNVNAPRRTPKRSYSKACEMAVDFIFKAPELTSLVSGNGSPRKDLPLAGYPSKTYSALIQAMVSAAKSVPSRREEALRAARLCAEWLLKNSQKPGTPLEYWPETYASDKAQQCWCPNYRDRIMLLYPATVGQAYLALAAETGEKRWVEPARRIAETYVRVRRTDGTWPLVLRIADGKALFDNPVVPNGLMLFFEMLYQATGDARWRTLGDECFAWLEKGPIADWNWEGQFEDTHPRAEKYGNLTHHAALDVMQYVLKRHPGDPERLKLARELMRFAEDQFVHWERPCLPDGRCLQFSGFRYYCGEQPNWRVPSATEQYDCYVAIDSSTAKLASSFYAIGRATGNGTDLAKARALGDRIVEMQCDDGSFPTFWNEKNAHCSWLNCHIYTTRVLQNLIGLDLK